LTPFTPNSYYFLLEQCAAVGRITIDALFGAILRSGKTDRPPIDAPTRMYEILSMRLESLTIEENLL
jgi:hypothetical protein